MIFRGRGGPRRPGVPSRRSRPAFTLRGPGARARGRALVLAGGLLTGAFLGTAAGCGPEVPDRDLPPAPPSSVGMSAEGLARATEALQARIENGDIAGVVAAVVRDGRLVYTEALGYRDLETQAPMEFDALFRMYSMTRPVTALGILLLHEEGLLDLHDPVQRHLPAFADQPVLIEPGSNDPDEVRPRVGDITLAQLLTHTSGIGSRSSALYRAHGVHAWDRTLEEVVDGVAALPLFEDPGTRYRYGMHSEVLGRVIEVVSGMPLDAFFEERIFGPLGMRDSVFRVTGDRVERLATVHRRDAEGQLRPFEMETIPVTGERALVSGGVGLVASTMDFLRFSRFLLDGRGMNGERLLSDAGLQMARENAVPEALLPIGPRGYWAGSGWSLGGLAVVLDPDAYGHPASEGEFWWDGSAGTRFWIDPRQELIVIVNAQVSPAGGGGFREEFRTLVDEAILERR